MSETDVEIVDICAENTIDEQIIKCLRKKENLLDSLKGGIKDKQSIKKSLSKCIFGSKYIFDCDDLDGGDKDV